MLERNNYNIHVVLTNILNINLQKQFSLKEMLDVLGGHTLQQGNVVSFQHDPAWETQTKVEVGQNPR